MIWGYPYFWKHPNTFNGSLRVVMKGYETPFSWAFRFVPSIFWKINPKLPRRYVWTHDFQVCFVGSCDERSQIPDVKFITKVRHLKMWPFFFWSRLKKWDVYVWIIGEWWEVGGESWHQFLANQCIPGYHKWNHQIRISSFLGFHHTWYIQVFDTEYTLQGTNISLQKWHFEDDFPNFPRWDMLIPWRVYSIKKPMFFLPILWQPGSRLGVDWTTRASASTEAPGVWLCWLVGTPRSCAASDGSMKKHTVFV